MIEVVPLSTHVGAEIRGFDFRNEIDPDTAAQLYAAAVAGAAPIEGAERAWLDDFAKALRLDRAATEAIERRIRGG